MEIVAISVDLWLAGDAGMGDPIFWAPLVFPSPWAGKVG